MTLNFPQTYKPRPHELSTVASELKAEFRGVPTVDSVLTRIAENETNLITCLEWFCCVKGKSEWDKTKCVEVANDSSLELWKAAKKVKWLKNYLLRSLLLNFALEVKITDSLLKTFNLYHSSLFANDRLVKSIGSISRGKRKKEGKQGRRNTVK